MTPRTLISRSIAMALAVGFAAGLSGCLKYEKKANSHTTGTTTIVCDNTFQNIMQQEIDVFEYQYPEAHILARYATQAEAFDSLMSLNTKTIVASRDISPREREILKGKQRTARSTKIAVDAVALIVNTENPVSKLTLKEVSEILSGSSTEWNDIWPCDLGKISVVFDDKASSLVTYMRDSLLNGEPMGANVYAQGSIPQVFKAVKESKNAIGVVGVSWITTDMASADMSKEDLAISVLGEEPVEGATLTDQVKVLALYNDRLDGAEARAYKPYQQYIFDGKYPLFRQMYMITTGASGSLAGGFYSFVTGNIGQKIIAKPGILPARMQRIQVELGE
ncbi:MAG: substrate-binding domain-containing protein [Muribaculaceae bacterium]|nr:substrate-binding domain-containing protein [Muribaculaceae bacterium]